MFKKTIVTAAALVIALPLTAFADDAKSTSSAKPKLEKVSKSGESLNPWTDCGIGAMIFDETKWAAVLSNVIWDLGTTAVTSNVSSKQTCEGKQVAAAFFINETYVNIEEETAKGNGAHLTAMLNILGCDTAVQPAIVASLRSDFSKSIMQTSYTEKSISAKAQDYYFMLDQQLSSNYAQQCKAI